MALVAVVYGMTRPSPTAPPNMTTVTRAAFVPEPLPADYTGVDLEGRAFAGSQLLGKVVLLDFWAVWCAPCIDAVPKLNRLRAEFPDEAFEVIGYAVFSGPGEDVEAFATDHGINYRVVVGDNDLALDYGVIGYPTYFLIDQQGQRVRKYVGALPGLEDRVIADVRALLGSSP